MNEVVIAGARLYEVALPLREPFRISGGELVVRRSLIVALEDESGLVGYGEAAPFELPFYSAETVASARDLLRNTLLPRLVGRGFATASEVNGALRSQVRGNAMARSAPETAWWDLQAAASGTSLADLVTNRLRELGVADPWLRRLSTIECGVALGIPRGESLAALRDDVERALERGYRRIKLKVMPGWDVEPVRTSLEIIRQQGSNRCLTADANGAYAWPDDERALRALDELHLLYLEQPLPEDALWDSCALQATLQTPICLDESLTSDSVARQVIAMAGPTVWNIKIQRVGGLEEACRIYARAVRAGVRLWGGTMPETGLGAQPMLALGCHAGFVYPSDLEPSDRWYPPGTDLVQLDMDESGMMAVPETRVIPDLTGKAELVAEFR